MREVLAAAAGAIPDKFADRPRVEAQIRKSIGWVYNELGESALAEPHLVRALVLFESTAGPDDQETLDTLTRLAGLRHMQGRHGEAAALHETLLERRRRTLGDDHRLTVQTMSNLGSNYRQLGRYAEAEPLLVAAVEGRRRILGPHHPGTYRSMEVLAGLHHSMGRHEEAERLFRETISGVQEHLGADHAEFCGPNIHMARMYLDLGRTRQARETIEGALDPCRRTWGNLHVYVIDEYDTASLAWIASGEWAYALARLGELRGRIEAEHGEDHPRVADVLWFMGRVEAARGRKAHAEAHLHRAMTVRGKPGRVPAPEITFWRACERGMLGDDNAALDLLQQAVDAGFGGSNLIELSPDLKRLRDQPRYKSLLARARQNASSPPPGSTVASSR
jgi:tetratricopeptide (TPR) repeat protein